MTPAPVPSVGVAVFSCFLELPSSCLPNCVVHRAEARRTSDKKELQPPSSAMMPNLHVAECCRRVTEGLLKGRRSFLGTGDTDLQ